MKFDKDVTFGFKSVIKNNDDVQNELNDLKAILLCVALKLDHTNRENLVTELRAIDSPSIKEWVNHLDEIGKP